MTDVGAISGCVMVENAPGTDDCDSAAGDEVVEGSPCDGAGEVALLSRGEGRSRSISRSAFFLTFCFALPMNPLIADSRCG